MPYLGRQLTSGNYLKLDDISSQFNGSKTTFNLKSGGNVFTPGSSYSLLVSLGGVIQEAISAFQIVEDKITFASAPISGANFFCVVLATTNVNPLTTLTIGSRAGAHTMDLHGRSMAVTDRSGTVHPIAFNLA